MDSFPGPVSTSVSLGSADIRIAHHASTALGGTPEAVVLRQPNVDPDTLTSIEIWPYDGQPSKTVLLLWERRPAADGVGVLLDEAAGTLFVGAGTFAAAVRLHTNEVVGAHHVFLFGSYRKIGKYVVELGELACFLREATGEILGEAAVDPPYEMFETPEGIRFESIVFGTQWLRFPDA